MTFTRVALVLLLLLPACTMGEILTPGCGYGRAEGVEPADLVGVFGTDATGTLTLKADGTFEAKGLRRKDHDGDAERVMAGTGTWELNHRGGRTERSEDYADVPLTFDATGETWFRIDIAASPVGYASAQVGFDLDLYYLRGDFDNCDIVKLDRQTPAPRKPSPVPSRSLPR